MKPQRLRRLERIARARRRMAEVELASASRRLAEARSAEEAARACQAQAAERRQDALVAGIDAGRVAGLHRQVEAWRQETAVAVRGREEAETGYDQAHRTFTDAYRDQRSMDLLAAGAERREAEERALRQRAEADDQALVRFALVREGR